MLGQEGATLRKFLRKKWRDNEIRALPLKAILEPDKRLMESNWNGKDNSGQTKYDCLYTQETA